MISASEMRQKCSHAASQTHARENCDPRRENKRTLWFQRRCTTRDAAQGVSLFPSL